jgi:hypothetical protein
MEEYLLPDEYTLPSTGIPQIPSAPHRWSASSLWRDHKSKIIGGAVGGVALAGAAVASGVAVRNKRLREENVAWNSYASDNYPVWDILEPSWGNDSEWDQTNMDRVYDELGYGRLRQRPSNTGPFVDASDMREHLHANDILDELDDEIYVPQQSTKRSRFS